MVLRLGPELISPLDEGGFAGDYTGSSLAALHMGLFAERAGRPDTAKGLKPSSWGGGQAPSPCTRTRTRTEQQSPRDAGICSGTPSRSWAPCLAEFYTPANPCGEGSCCPTIPQRAGFGGAGEISPHWSWPLCFRDALAREQGEVTLAFSLIDAERPKTPPRTCTSALGARVTGSRIARHKSHPETFLKGIFFFFLYFT